MQILGSSQLNNVHNVVVVQGYCTRNNSSTFKKNEEIDLEEDEDGSTLVFGDGRNQTHEADQNQKDESDIPAYMRKQNQ